MTKWKMWEIEGVEVEKGMEMEMWGGEKFESLIRIYINETIKFNIQGQG